MTAVEATTKARPLSYGWCQNDERLMRTWAELGYIPDGQSTQDCVERMLFGLWARHQQVVATMMELAASMAPAEDAA